MNCPSEHINNCQGEGQLREVQWETCSEEKIRAMTDYWQPRINSTYETIKEYSVCINDGSLFLRSEKESPLYSTIHIVFESCIEADATDETCMDEE